MKPVVALDVDGVLANFTGHMLTALGAPLKEEDVTQWDVFGMLSPELNVKAKALLKTDEFWDSQPLLPHADEGVKLLRDEGFDVIFVTSPWLGHKAWAHVRREWLKRHVGAAPDEVIVCMRKEHVKADVLIDDKLENVRAWATAHVRGLAVLFSAPYNDFPGAWLAERMHDWQDLGRIMRVMEGRGIVASPRPVAPPRKKKVYVASSWENDGPLLDNVHQELRAAGLDTFDFREVHAGRHPRRWWQGIETSADARENLFHPLRRETFRLEAAWLDESDAVLVVLPAGVDTHCEGAWAAGAGKRVAVWGTPREDKYHLMMKLMLNSERGRLFDRADSLQTVAEFLRT